MQHSSRRGHHDKVVNFHDIVDEDERGMENKFSQVYLGQVLESLPFRMIMLVAIILDSLTIGIQTNQYLVRRTSR